MPLQALDVGCWGMSGPVPDAIRLLKMTHSGNYGWTSLGVKVALQPPTANRKPTDASRDGAQINQKSAPLKEVGVMQVMVRADHRGENYANETSKREGVPETKGVAYQ